MEGYDNTTYGDAFADVYDDWYADVSDIDATIADLVRLCSRSDTTPAGNADGLASQQVVDRETVGPTVVELGVGTGRLAIPLAAALANGRVIGIDSSEAMLSRLHERARQLDRSAGASAQGQIETVHGDMIDALGSVAPGEQVDMVLAAYNTLFNLTSDGAQQACFDAVARRLRPGGHLVIEAFVPDEPPRDGSDVAVRSMTVDKVVLSLSRHDSTRHTIEGQFVELTEDAGVRLRPWSIRYSTPAELDAMAVAAGLVLEYRDEAFGGVALSPDSARHVSVYRRDG